MVETAIGIFGLSMRAALNLTILEFIVHGRANVRRIRAQHERDTWHAWISAEFVRNRVSHGDMMKMATGRGKKQDPNDPDGGLALQRQLEQIAGFEAWYRGEQESNGHG